MERVILNNQPRAVRISETILYQRQVAVFVATIKLVTDDRMANMREMNPDLMFAAGVRDDLKQRKGKREHGGRAKSRRGSYATEKSLLDKKLRLRRHSVRTDTIFDGDRTSVILAEWRINKPVVLEKMAVDNGQVFFSNGAAFENSSKFAGGPGVFGNQYDAAGFAVQAVDETGRI